MDANHQDEYNGDSPQFANKHRNSTISYKQFHAQMKLNYQLPTQVVARLYDDLDFGKMYFGQQEPESGTIKKNYEHRDDSLNSRNVVNFHLTTQKSDSVI